LPGRDSLTTRSFGRIGYLGPVLTIRAFQSEQINLDLGLTQPNALQGLLQLNLNYQDHESGLQGEPEESGSKTVWLSPGLSYAASPKAHVYGFVQLPLYQYVNGTQLNANRVVSAGWSQLF